LDGPTGSSSRPNLSPATGPNLGSGVETLGGCNQVRAQIVRHQPERGTCEPLIEAETVVAGEGLLEGPVWRPATADLLVTLVGGGRVLRIDLNAGRAHAFAETRGGPNGAFPCADGGLLVAQNGGLDWEAIGIFNPAPSEPTTPGLQQVSPTSEVTLLTGSDGPFRAPNDLCAGPEGTIWFTDPPQFPRPPEPIGRVWRWVPGGRPEVFAGGFSYCNGIGLDRDGRVLIVEDRGLMWVEPDGTRSWLIETLPSGGDGFAFDVEGNIYVAGGRHVTVVSPDGQVVQELDAPLGPAMVTNCCFGGPDMRTLFATEGLGGRVIAFGSMPVAGAVLVPLAL
jgi:gluconolactonase